jgi:hypothetical protein
LCAEASRREPWKGAKRCPTLRMRNVVMASEPGSTPPSLSAGEGISRKLRTFAEITSTLCAVGAVLISVITWRGQQAFNNDQDEFNKVQQQLALTDERRQEEQYASRVAIWDQEVFGGTEDLPDYSTYLVVQNRGQAPLNQVVVIWPHVKGNKLKTKTAVLDFIPPCSSVKMPDTYFTDERFSMNLEEEANAAGPPVVEFNDANRVAWERSATGQLQRIDSAKLAPYVSDEPNFYVPRGKEHSVNVSETSNCGG